MIRHTSRLALFPALLLGLWACGDDVDPDRAETLQGHGVRLSEANIASTITGKTLATTFTLERTEARTIPGTLRMELLALGNDTPLDTGSAKFSLDAATAQVTVKVNAPSVSELAALGGYVLRYTVALPGGELYGLRSLFMTVARAGLTVIGNNRFAVGEQGVLRVLVTDQTSGKGLAGQAVEVSFTPSGGASRTLSTGKTGAQGEYEATFTFGKTDKGAGTIAVKTDKHSSTHSVIVEQEQQVMVTTDKPLYQPGQTVYIRALALRQPRLVPLASETLLMEVEDPKGTKLFKETTATDKWGIASLKFKLARLVLLGTYTVRLTMGTTTRTKTFRVDKYTLPKFKVRITTHKAYYRPGDTITGSVQADYFFGEPVKSGDVTLSARSALQPTKIADVVGKTDSKGAFSFSFKATYGSAVIISAQVEDAAGAKAEASATVTLATSDEVLQVVADQDEVAVGEAAQFYVMVTDPAGKPKAAKVKVTGLATGTVDVPASGVAVHTVTPDHCYAGSNVSINYSIGSTTKSLSLSCVQAGGALRVATDKAVYKENDTAKVTLTAPKAASAAVLEVRRQNATVKTVQVKLVAGKGTADVALTGDLRRTLVLKAHALLGSTIYAHQRLIYVQGADQLSVKVSTDKSQYKPADKAKVSIRLTDTKGNAAPGALGVQVVDEALYAMTEFKPGVERSFFFLEQEVVDAGKTLSYVSPSLLLKDKPAAADQAMVRMLFAAAGEKATYPIHYRSQDKGIDYAVPYSAAGIKAVVDGLERAFRDKWENSDHEVREKKSDDANEWLEARLSVWVDHFGVPYRYTVSEGYCQVRSAGMDETWDTTDDLSESFYWTIGRGNGVDIPGTKYYDASASSDGGSWGYPDAGSWYADAGGWGYPDAGSYPSADAGAPSSDTGASKTDSGSASTVVRQYFPETLYVDPALITDSQGKATIDLSLADSITTWKLTGIAHTAAGQLGSTTADIKVFQSFFVDTLLPTHLVQNDQVSVPVAVYNYTTAALTVGVTIKSESWFTLLDAATKQVTVPARSVGSVMFKVKADKVGTFGFTATGTAGSDADAVKRSIEVLPDGERKEVVFGGPLKAGKVSHTVTIPSGAIAGASDLFVRIFPGLLAETMEGLESIFKEPYGCFEQTSSATYPNVLVLQYLKRAGKSSPALETKAKSYIESGYQRLIGYEVSGGGFSLYGDAPAKLLLTAFGLMEFSDMAKVRYVDKAMIARTQSWLVARQAGDGSYSGYDGGCYGYGGSTVEGKVAATAYVAWALLQAGDQSGAATRALSYVKANLSQVSGTYAQAVAANALLAQNLADTDAADLLAKLKAKAQVSGDKAHWTGKGCSMFYGYGYTMDVETTALVTAALILAKDSGSLAKQGLDYLTAAKKGHGGWGATSATVQALRTLLLALDARGGDNAAGTIAVSHNGVAQSSVQVTPATSDVTRFFDLKSQVVTGGNQVDITFSGTGELAYQVVGVYYLPHGTSSTQSPLSFAVSYDKTTVKVGESIRVSAEVKNTGSGTVPAMMMKLGLPPGFSVELSTLTPQKTGGMVKSAELLAPYLVLYMDDLTASQKVVFDMKASLPVQAQAPPSLAYPYYTPEYGVLVDMGTVTVTAQ